MISASVINSTSLPILIPIFRSRSFMNASNASADRLASIGPLILPRDFILLAVSVDRIWLSVFPTLDSDVSLSVPLSEISSLPPAEFGFGAVAEGFCIPVPDDCGVRPPRSARHSAGDPPDVQQVEERARSVAGT